MANERSAWIANAIAYSLAGLVASGCLGLSLGYVGGAFGGPRAPIVSGTTAALLCGLALGHEIGLIKFPLPQIHRQTRGTWAKIFPRIVASALWGLDIGLVFTTFVSFTGAWILAAIALVTGDPVFGAALFVCYWGGRALSVWYGPFMSAAPVPALVQAVFSEYRTFARIHVIALLLALSGMLAWVWKG